MKTLQEGIQDLSDAGLNLFACCPMKELSKELQDSFTQANIPWNQEQSLVLIGHGGRTMWNKLPKPFTQLHPVDSYALEKVELFNQTVLQGNLVMLYPKSQWQAPLLKIGRFFNLGKPSEMGLDIHPEYGLWFAYRAAFLTDKKLPKIISEEFTSPCVTCVGKPCLSAGGGWKEARVACVQATHHRYNDDQLNY